MFLRGTRLAQLLCFAMWWDKRWRHRRRAQRLRPAPRRALGCQRAHGKSHAGGKAGLGRRSQGRQHGQQRGRNVRRLDRLEWKFDPPVAAVGLGCLSRALAPLSLTRRALMVMRVFLPLHNRRRCGEQVREFDLMTLYHSGVRVSLEQPPVETRMQVEM